MSLIMYLQPEASFAQQFITKISRTLIEVENQ